MNEYERELLVLMLINFGVGKYVTRNTIRDLGATIYSEIMLNDCVNRGWIFHGTNTAGMHVFGLSNIGVEELKREHLPT